MTFFPSSRDSAQPPYGSQPSQRGPEGPGYTGAWQPPSPRRGGGLKWILAAIVLVVVIGVTAAVTWAVSERGSHRDQTHSNVSPDKTASVLNSDMASANDTAPVAVIVDDPSCAAQYTVTKAWAEKSRNGWDKRALRS